MRKAILFLILILSASSLFAEERTQLFKRETFTYYLSLEKVVDNNNETYFFIMTLEPEETRDNYTACYLYLWGNSEDAAKTIISCLSEEKEYYNYLINELELEISKKDIKFSKDKLLHCYYFSLDIE